jgi:hypothetical protein
MGSPQLVSFDSQRLAQSAADAGVPPDVAVPDVPDVPVGVDAVDEEQATVSNAPSAIEERRNVEREE